MAAALPFVYQAAVGIALSYAAGLLLQEDIDTPIVDHGPTPTVERGTPINMLIGRDRLGPIYTWYGSRFSQDEEVDGGKGLGGGEQEQTIWYEEGFHVITLGPARRLWQIKDNGKVIFVGPIDPASHPSGTTIDLGDGSSFVIYWGEADQPENTVLGAAGKLTEAGNPSRWPYLCYVHWLYKRLGTSPIWPRLTYDTEVWPFDTKLAATASWFPASRTLVGPVQDIDDTFDGAAGVAYVEFADDDNSFKASGWCRIEGQTIPDGDYRVDSVVKPSGTLRRIILGQSITGLTDNQGTIQAYQDNDDDGANAAHIIYQLLFVPPPHGRGLDPARWDMASLEALGVLCYQEDLRTTILAEGDKTYKSCVADILQDVGAMTYRNTRTGLLGFRTIRESDEIAVLTDVHICGDPPEISNVVESRRPGNRKLFTFKDRLRDYFEYPIQIDDDGTATLDQSYGRERIPMSTVRDLTTAWTVAKRRNQESYSGDMPVTLRSKNQGCLLEPGQQLTIPDLDVALLVLSSDRRDFLSGEIELDVIPNYFGVPASNAVVYDGGGLAEEVEESSQDLEVIPFEVPQRLNNTGSMRVGVARIRNAATVSKANIYLSDDDVSFFQLGQDASIHTGGQLDASVGADGLSFLDSGPTFTAEGVDIESALDLSAASSKFEWQSGRQVCLVGDGLDYEIWFVRWIESLGGGQYRMREVLRHRFCTEKQAWASGTPVILFDSDQVNQFTDLILTPNDSYYLKSQPIGPSSIALDDISSHELDAYGEGVRPLPVSALYGGDTPGRQANCYVFPNSVFIRWGYRAAPGPSNSCPAGLPAGEPVFARPPCDGTLRLRITDPNDGDALVRQVDLPLDQTAEYEYTQDQIKSDFGLSAGYTPATLQMNWRSTAASPAPTQPATLTNDHSPGTLNTGTAATTPLTVSVAGFQSEWAVAVTEAGFLSSALWPAGDHTAVVRLENTFANDTTQWRVSARAVRYDASNVFIEQGVLSAQQNITGTADYTFVLAPPVGGWTAGTSTDRFGVALFFQKLNTGTGLADINSNAGLSYVTGPLFDSPAIDFDVEASVVKGAQQSGLTTVSILNMGGTTT
jgi:hypothetical protein